MDRKLFIVARDQAALYRTLTTALGNEPEVEILYDRRVAAPTVRVDPEDRRQQPDLTETLRTRGFAVVRLQREAEGNIRWSA